MIRLSKLSQLFFTLLIFIVLLIIYTYTFIICIVYSFNESNDFTFSQMEADFPWSLEMFEFNWENLLGRVKELIVITMIIMR